MRLAFLKLLYYICAHIRTGTFLSVLYIVTTLLLTSSQVTCIIDTIVTLSGDCMSSKAQVRAVNLYLGYEYSISHKDFAYCARCAYAFFSPIGEFV